MKTCLVVDDSKVIRMVASKIVKEMGFAVAEVGDGQQALAYCQEQLPDVILLDWLMPVKSGYDFMLELRMRPEAKDVKIIFCTTQDQKEDIERALQNGADAYITKPFDSVIVRQKFMEVGLLS